MSKYDDIFRVVLKIPEGKVATYGLIADLAGASGPRQVGYALHRLQPHQNIPWHRVINAQGEVSLRSTGNGHALQIQLLKLEGVEFNEKNRLDLKKFLWKAKVRLTKRGKSCR